MTTVTLSPLRSNSNLNITSLSSIRANLLPGQTLTHRILHRRSSYTMPGLVNSARDPVVLVRELHADEDYVMGAFERHASHCTRCADPIRTYDDGRTLCERGHQYALDVAEYLYSRNGKAHSVVDKELHQATLVKVPRSYASARGLLLAIEDGLRLRRKERNLKSPVISYDRDHQDSRSHSPPRRASYRYSLPAYHEIIEREPRTPKRRRVIVYPSPRSSPSRGSLYNSDAVDRVERYYGSSRVHRPAEYYR